MLAQEMVWSLKQNNESRNMETEEKLKKRIAYEKMLAGISERAVSVDDLDEFLDESLRRMGGILDVSRIFIFTYHPVSDTFACICEWVATGITTLADLDELKITIPYFIILTRNTAKTSIFPVKTGVVLTVFPKNELITLRYYRGG